MRPTPIISGLLRAAKIGLASKGMTHGMTKLLCVSVRLGLYPTDICWLRLIQAPEKPGIRVRHRWLPPPPPPPPRFRRGRRNVFTASLKYNCLYKRGAGLSAAADCFPPFQQIYYFLSPSGPELRVMKPPTGPSPRRRHLSSSVYVGRTKRDWLVPFKSDEPQPARGRRGEV